MDSLLPDPNRGPSLMVMLVVLTVISTIVVIIRLYSKIFVLRSMGWDDRMIAVALIFSIGFMALVLVAIKYGLGRHVYDLEPHQINEMHKYFIIATLLYNLTVFCVKSSVLLMLLRVEKLKRWVQTVIYFALLLVFFSLATATIVQLVQCMPITRNYLPARAHCLSVRLLGKVYIVALVFPAATDFICAILPFFILWDLKINTKAKISIWIVLCLGMCPGIFSVIRTASVFNHFMLLDITWLSVPYFAWSIGEIHWGIIFATIPTLRAPVLRVMTRLRGAPKVSICVSELRNPSRFRVLNQHEHDDGTDLFPSHEMSGPINQSSASQATDLEVAKSTSHEAEVKPENASERRVQIISSISGGQ